MERIYKIYSLNDPITNEIRYIGLTKKKLETRLCEHISGSKSTKSSKTYKKNWIKSLLDKGLEPVINLIESSLTLNEVKEREIFYISLFKKTCRLTNATEGGDGTSGYKLSEESKRKIGEKNKKSLTGRKLSETHRENIGKAREGMHLSQESKDKLAKKVKQEWANNVERLAEMKARTGANNPNWGGKFPGVIIHDKDGNTIGDFEHLQQASDLTGLTKTFIRACALGKKKSTKYNIEMK